MTWNTWLGITWLNYEIAWPWSGKGTIESFLPKNTLLYSNIWVVKVVLKRSFWRKSFNPTCHIKMNWKPKMNLELSHLVSRIILVYGSHFQVSNRLSLLDDRILQWCRATSMLVTDVWRWNVLVTTLRCWWQFWPFSSPTSSIVYGSVGHQHSKDVINIENSHQHKVTNIHLSPTSM